MVYDTFFAERVAFCLLVAVDFAAKRELATLGLRRASIPFTSPIKFVSFVCLIDAGDGVQYESEKNEAEHRKEFKKTEQKCHNWGFATLSYRTVEGDARFRPALRGKASNNFPILA